MGPRLVRHALKRSGAADVEQSLTLCAELGVEFLICPASAATLGIGLEDLDPRLATRFCGMTEYLARAARAKVSMLVG
jgi:peroxiredoxin family protein